VQNHQLEKISTPPKDLAAQKYKGHRTQSGKASAKPYSALKAESE